MPRHNTTMQPNHSRHATICAMVTVFAIPVSLAGIALLLCQFNLSASAFETAMGSFHFSAARTARHSFDFCSTHANANMQDHCTNSLKQRNSHKTFLRENKMLTTTQVFSTTTTSASGDQLKAIRSGEQKQQPPLLLSQQVNDMSRQLRSSSRHFDTKEPIVHFNSTSSFNLFLKTWVNAGKPGGPAEKLLRYMILEKGNADHLAVAAPNVVTLNTVLAAYAKNDNHDKEEMVLAAARSAHELLRDWQAWYRAKEVEEDADIVAFNTVLSACARVGAVDQAEEIFEFLLSPDDNGNITRGAKTGRLAADKVSYGSLLHTYAVAGRPAQAEKLLHQMLSLSIPSTNSNDSSDMNTTAAISSPMPSVHCYNEVLLAYSLKGQPEKAEQFLQWWCHEQQMNKNKIVKPDTRSYNILLAALKKSVYSNATSWKKEYVARRAQQLFESISQPDSVSFTTLIAIFCKCSIADTSALLEQVESILKKAWKCRDIKKNKGAACSFVSNVLYSLASAPSGSRADRYSMPTYAEQLVRTMTAKKLAFPNVQVYNALLHCWSRSGDHRAGKRALAILARLEKDYRYQPNIKTYTNVLDALAKSSRRDPDALSEAEKIMQLMEEGSKTTGGKASSSRSQPRPNVQAYTSLIQNYAWSRDPNKAVKAAAVLERMKNSGTQPNIITYNLILNAAEHTYVASDAVATEEALLVAFHTFEEVRLLPTVTANHVTYGSFLGVLANLMPSWKAREEIVELVFKRCSMEGQVSPLVLKKLKLATAGSQQATYMKLTKGLAETPAKLPSEWTRNVIESKARRISSS